MKISNIFFDIDGVLADFIGRIRNLGIRNAAPTESICREIYSEDIRTAINYYRWNLDGFYASLNPLPDAHILFNRIYSEYSDKCEILSVVPELGFGTLPAMNDKEKWVRKNINSNIIVNIVFREEIPMFCKDKGSVYISALEENVNYWNELGGIAILFRGSQGLITQLHDLEGADRSAESVEKEREALNAKIIEAIEGNKTNNNSIWNWPNRKYGRLRGNREKAFNAWTDIKKYCETEEISLEHKYEEIFKSVFQAYGVKLERVPVRYYPSIDYYSGSLCVFKGIEDADKLYYDQEPIGKTYEFLLRQKIGNDYTYISYFFIVEEHRSIGNPGVMVFEGTGKPEGYRWAEGSIRLEKNGDEIRAVAIQKMYLRPMEPIWKKLSPNPVEDYIWLGLTEDIPEEFELTDSGFYRDETTDPPRGRNYREQGILAYDDNEDEIVVLGVTDYLAEVVQIPQEINGKPVTILDDYCFRNCYRNLKKVILPDTIREIGDYAFLGCTELEEPYIPDSVEVIGKEIFKNTRIAISI